MIFILLAVSAGRAFSQGNRQNMPLPSDSSVIQHKVTPVHVPESENIQRFYDSLRSKSSKSTIPNLIYSSLFRRPRRDTTQTGQIIDENVIYEKFRDKTVGKIYIQRDEIYEADSRGLRRYANKVHVLTRENVIRRDLLFKTGDKIDPYQIVMAKQLLLSRNYISQADITFISDDIDSTVVDAVVWTKDRWTISMDGSWRSSYKTMVEIYDANIFGSGNRLSVQTSFNRKTWRYQGNRIHYDIPNILGTFYSGSFKWGRDFYDRLLDLQVSKQFIRPTDYEAGVSFNDDRLEYYSLYKNEKDSIKTRRFQVWAGNSYYIKSLKSSIYYTASLNSQRFPMRPEVGPRFNPALHGSDLLLAGFGFYREKLYAANMIYGYGNQEYLASGYRTELVGGYNWGEFHNDYYMGVSCYVGGFTGIGYLIGEFDLGSYIDHKSGAWWQSAIDIDIKWISDLYRFRRSNMRQFISLSHTRGWNRGEGNKEVITFTRLNGPKTLVDEYLIGINRTVLNSETVFFTPFQPWGFRMAIFGFCDLALLGNEANLFKNQFFATTGFGIRLKNERLVFNTIQIRLGVAIGKSGFLHNQYVRLSSEQRINATRFIPSYPRPVGFE